MLQMTVTTYNLRNGGNAKNRIHWAKLFEAVNPEIALFQETCHPEQYMPADFWQDVRPNPQWVEVRNTGWGSAIYVGSGSLKPISVPGYDGCVVGAEVRDFEWLPLKKKRLRIFSLHAPSPYRQSVNRILDFIATLPQDDDLIIGGDFNLSVGVRHPSEALLGQDLWLLRRLRREFGLMNCWQTANPNQDLPQTLRWSGNPTAHYHCDGLFVPASWYRYLDQSTVLNSPDWEALSDHNPVVASFSSSAN
jgi:hypothetical protein